MRYRQIITAAFAFSAFSQAKGQTEWIIRESGTLDHFRKVVFAGDQFYTSNWVGGLYHSLDGIEWKKSTLSSIPAGFEVLNLIPVAGGPLVLTYNHYWPPTNIRDDIPGQYNPSADSDADYLNGVAVIINLFDGDGQRVGRYSDSTKKISVHPVPWEGRARWVTATDSEFLVGAGFGIFSSADGITWIIKSRQPTDRKPFFHNGVLYSGNRVSRDFGKTWETVSGSLTPDVHAAGVFVRRESAGLISTSSDAVKWVTQETGTTNDLNGIAFGKNTFVAVGSNGRIITSTVSGSPPPPVAPQLSVVPSVTLKWTSRPDFQYQIEVSSDMQTWVAFSGGIPGSGAEITRSFEVTGQRRYFRVTVR